jgi:hypothetical protein
LESLNNISVINKKIMLRKYEAEIQLLTPHYRIQKNGSEDIELLNISNQFID